MTNHKMTLAVSAVASASLGLLSACSLGKPPATPEQLQALEQVHDATCPNDEALNEYIANDRSASVSETVNSHLRLPAIESEITRIAVCGGKVTVADFAGTSDSVVLFSGELKPTGATLKSRLRKVPDLVEATMAAITEAQAHEDTFLTTKGTNVAAQFTNVADFFNQVGGGANQLRRVLILTDGMTTSDVTSPVPLPDDTIVLISGVGQFDASQKKPSQERINAAKAALDTACASTGAQCLSATTDYVGATAK
jgi:hypothetical protein